MTSIGSLISPVLKQTLMGAVALNESVSEPDEVRVTFVNGVEYDMRSGALVDTICADCPAGLRVEVAPEPNEQWLLAGRTRAEFHDLLCSKPRVAVCTPCGQARTSSKQGVVVHANPKEAPVPEIDLTKYSEAELAQLAIKARAHMVAEAEALIPGKRAEAQAAETERVATDQVLKEQQREERKVVLPFLDITIKGQTRHVPALDLGEVTDLNEIVSPAMRSPYNKALYALGMDLLGKDTATYAVVAEAHTMLMEHSSEPAPTFEALATVVEPEGKAKVDPKVKIKAYAEVMGISEKKARKRLEKVGVI